jgi:hypothetical protein
MKAATSRSRIGLSVFFIFLTREQVEGAELPVLTPE